MAATTSGLISEPVSAGEGPRRVDERPDAELSDHVTRRHGDGLLRDRGIAANQEAQAGHAGQGTQEGPTLGLEPTHLQPPRVSGCEDRALFWRAGLA